MKILVAVLAGVALAYLGLIVALVLARPRGNALREALRLLPDLLRFVRRLAADRSLPRGARARLWLLLGYLAMPIDLIPDFIPVIGYADDAIVVSLVLRSVVRRLGDERVQQAWPGTSDGLRALGLVTGMDLARS